VLLRALAIQDPDGDEARRLTVDAIEKQTAWFEHLGTFPALQALSVRAAWEPMDVVTDPGQRALLAEALLAEGRPPEAREVESALQELEERALEGQQRALRAQIAEAERNGDYTGLALLTRRKLELDRALRQLHGRKALEQ